MATRSKNRKRAKKRKALVAERKEQEQRSRKKAAIDRTIRTNLSLADVEVSQDMFTAKPGPSQPNPTHPSVKSVKAKRTTPNPEAEGSLENREMDEYPRTVDNALEKRYRLISWDGR